MWPRGCATASSRPHREQQRADPTKRQAGRAVAVTQGKRPQSPGKRGRRDSRPSLRKYLQIARTQTRTAPLKIVVSPVRVRVSPLIVAEYFDPADPEAFDARYRDETHRFGVGHPSLGRLSPLAPTRHQRRDALSGGRDVVRRRKRPDNRPAVHRARRSRAARGSVRSGLHRSVHLRSAAALTGQSVAGRIADDRCRAQRHRSTWREQRFRGARARSALLPGRVAGHATGRGVANACVGLGFALRPALTERRRQWCTTREPAMRSLQGAHGRKRTPPVALPFAKTTTSVLAGCLLAASRSRTLSRSRSRSRIHEEGAIWPGRFGLSVLLLWISSEPEQQPCLGSARATEREPRLGAAEFRYDRMLAATASSRMDACSVSARSRAALRRRSNAHADVEAGLRKGPDVLAGGRVGSAGMF